MRIHRVRTPLSPDIICPPFAAVTTTPCDLSRFETPTGETTRSSHRRGTATTWTTSAWRNGALPLDRVPPALPTDIESTRVTAARCAARWIANTAHAVRRGRGGTERKAWTGVEASSAPDGQFQFQWRTCTVARGLRTSTFRGFTVTVTATVERRANCVGEGRSQVRECTPAGTWKYPVSFSGTSFSPRPPRSRRSSSSSLDGGRFNYAL